MKTILNSFIPFCFILVFSIAIFDAYASEMPSINEGSLEMVSSDLDKDILEDESNVEEEQEEFIEEEIEEESIKIADPVYPWNKAMYHFNDRFYFWLLKPVTQAYSYVAPEDIRLSVSNFFQNLTSPIRIVNNLLQLKMKNAGNELVRFIYNSTAGIGGLADAAKTDLKIRLRDEDMGQTFGSYGIGHGFYIVWPFIGPCSVRDTVGKIGDAFLDPVDYISPVETAVGITVYDKVNETSFHIGDYEDLKKSAIDPYVSIRNAYIQHRKKEVEE